MQIAGHLQEEEFPGLLLLSVARIACIPVRLPSQ